MKSMTVSTATWRRTLLTVTQWGDTVRKDACRQVWQPQFQPQDQCGRRKEPWLSQIIPWPAHTDTHMHSAHIHTYTHMNEYKSIFKEVSSFSCQPDVVQRTLSSSACSGLLTTLPGQASSCPFNRWEEQKLTNPIWEVSKADSEPTKPWLWKASSQQCF